MTMTAHNVETGPAFGAHTPCNQLSVPEIAHYRREVTDDVVIVTYAIRGANESLWTGVQLVIDDESTSETRTGPHQTPEEAVQMLNE